MLAPSGKVMGAGQSRAQVREVSAYRSKGLCCSPGILCCLLPGLLQRLALHLRRQVELQKERQLVAEPKGHAAGNKLYCKSVGIHLSWLEAV